MTTKTLDANSALISKLKARCLMAAATVGRMVASTGPARGATPVSAMSSRMDPSRPAFASV